MLVAALRYPLATRAGRDGVAICSGLVVTVLLLVRAALALWPAWVALLPASLIAVPTVLFAGYLGSFLEDVGGDGRDDTPPRFTWSRTAVRRGGRVLAVGGVYLLPAVAALLGTVFVLLETGASPGSGPLVAIAPTVALFVLVGFAYFVPAALATGVHGGVRAGLSRTALDGLASAGYFYAWTASAAVLVVSWSLLGTVGLRSPVALVGAALGAYGTVVAVRLLAQGLARSRWDPPE